MSKLKLIWDFRGPDALKIAEHHVKHLNEYIAIQKTDLNITDFQQVHEMHSIAYMVVTQEEMKPIRDALKPHRGEIYND
ncbi:hypothetical protein ESY86_06575 [Subsaximicrobium wynnwilliamsii]|jgi:hypothetical protein|uniref:Uncharacterized protein n=1 Tax=Subsaximicrobium wynnwilliamsii TaxID=291179 RepID=A0A5C6ZJX7_9FLAO|nr:hypothetical protein [Subsaximicrobium wynnwilliamsii]TXD84241.1 hypothetical protein ESY87_06990 [Subsaximicrobium wynnwilliamsii]TXD89862.1 hypothetical protein ESY86_06575 [Subsaximicrobium wynnwilliamsii]TXE03953.1 hypothetical protein ESY88_06985 [Subsaximicrobium wynnwilliamsii]